MERSALASAKSATANVSPETPAGAGQALPDAFFDRDAAQLARELLGKVIRHRVGSLWLSARIIETEAYYLEEKGSHASLGYTHKRRALFMDGGTVYMYYARGGDSLNFSAAGPGNAVLIRIRPTLDRCAVRPKGAGPHAGIESRRPGAAQAPGSLCAGQTLLCRALGLKVPDWDARRFDPRALYVDDVGEAPAALICTTRLGIPLGRDEHLSYRFVDPGYAAFCTRNPLRRGQRAGHDYVWVDRQGIVLREAPEMP